MPGVQAVSVLEGGETRCHEKNVEKHAGVLGSLGVSEPQ